jgi:hypothetical protein
MTDQEKQLIARCANIAMKAVTRWYTEHLYREGYSLEMFVRDEVRKLQGEEV